MYESSSDKNAIKEHLQTWLKPENLINEFGPVNEWNINEKSDIIMDFHIENFEFCSIEAFTPMKISTFFNLMNFILYESLKQRLTWEQTFILFKEHLLRHAILRPPHSLSIFNLNEVKSICKFVQENFLKLFDLYQYTLLPHLSLSLGPASFFDTEEPTSATI